MKKTLRGLAVRLRTKFRGLYWRQMFVTVGMVLLTLFLLGASFFSLSYNYARGQRDEELAAQARVVGQLSVSYLESGRYLDIEELQHEEDFQHLATFAATVSDVDFLICDVEGHVLLSTDETMSGLVVTMPEKMTAEALEDGITSSRTDVDGLYENRRFVVGVPAVSADSEDAAGVVYAVSATTSLDTMWSGFVGLFFMTAFVVLMISFMASSITTMRQIQPIREMARATRRYAEGDFDIRMNDYGREDELGELAASFNNMAESLQQTERQRREFIANISHELKTPMTTIAGYTDGILDGTIPPENERQYLQIISDESRRLSRLVRRMLDVSQLQVMDPLREGKHFDICESMRRGADLHGEEDHRPSAGCGGRHPRGAHPGAGGPGHDHPGDLQPAGERHQVRPGGVHPLPGSGQHRRQGQSDGAQCGRDDPAGGAALLFERFHKSDKSRSEDKDGYGLGLYIVKTILEQHKEKISVTSEEGVTTFSFSLATE